MTDSPALCPRCRARLPAGSSLGQLCPRCLMLLALSDHGPPVADAPGTRFGAYRLLEKVGEGGMGVVWRAQQEYPIRRVVAVKVVKPGADSRHVLARFESERQALAILNHPNIATVFDAGVTPDGRPFFVLEYVPGLPVTVYADRYALAIPARLELFLQVCEAVEHAHQKGLLHRDLKPTNILVTDVDQRPVVKVIDFGIAKAIGPQVSPETVETQMGMLLGTPEYMSPEQAGLMDAGVDTRTDIYSLGLVLYELLAGALPFDARDLRRHALLEMLRVIREDDPPRLTTRLTSQSEAQLQNIARCRLTEPRALVRQLRGDLEWITGRALEKEPARRYPSASELRADIRRHLRDEAVLAGPPSLTYRVGKFARRHRALTAVSVVLTITVLAAALLATGLWIRSERARSETRRQLAASLVASGVARLDAWDWSGALLSFARALEIEPDRQRERVHRVRIGQVLQRMPPLVRLWPHGQRVTSLDVSAQGIIASAGTDGTVRLWSLQSGLPIGQPLRHGDAVHKVVFSADGRLVASASEDGTARIWRAADGAPAGPPLRHTAGVRDVAFSPDAQAVATGGADGRARLWRVGADAAHLEIDLGTPVMRVIFTRDGSRFAAGAEHRDERPFTVRISATAAGAAAAPAIRGEPGWLLTDLDFSADGRHIVTAGNQGCHCGRLWDAGTGRQVGAPLTHRNAVGAARFDASGAHVVTAGYDRIVQRWKVPTAEPASPPWTISGWPEFARFAEGQLIAGTVNGALEIIAPGNTPARENSRLLPTFMHAGPVTAAAFDRSGRFLITGSGDGAVRVWDVAPALAWEPAFAWYSSEWISDMAFFADGRRLAAAARVFDTATGLPVVPPLRTESMDFFLAVSRDGLRIATAGQRLTRVWDASTGEPVSPLLAPDGTLAPHQPLVLSPDGQRLLTLSNRDGAGEAVVWDVASGTRAVTLKHAGAVTTGAFSPDGALILTGTSERDTNLRVWRTDGTVVSSGRHPEGVFAAVFDGSGDRIVTVGLDQRVLQWRAGATLQSTDMLELHSEPSWLTISPARSIVAGGRGGDVRARTQQAGRATNTSMSQSGAVMSADVSTDEQWLVTSGDDGRVSLWAIGNGERLSPAFRLPGPVYSTRFAPDRQSFAAGAGGVYMFPVMPDERPRESLTELAEVLSARHLVDAADHPLRLADLVARWTRLTQRGAPAVEPAVPSWHGRQASRALFQNNPALALDELAMVEKAGRPAWTTIMISVSALARAGRWADAVDAVRRLDAARHAAPELDFVEAVARQRAGDPQAPADVCQRLLERHATTRNPDRALWILRVCLLAPRAAATPAWAGTTPLLDQVVNLAGYGTRASLGGALAVRSGRLDEGIALLRRAVEEGEEKEETPHTSLFLALAFAGQGRAGDARTWLAASEAYVWPGALLFSQKAFRDTWFDAEAAILRDEITRLIDGRR